VFLTTGSVKRVLDLFVEVGFGMLVSLSDHSQNWRVCNCRCTSTHAVFSTDVLSIMLKSWNH